MSSRKFVLLLAAAFVLIIPLTIRAQNSSCGYLSCSTYGFYFQPDNTVYGYTRVVDSVGWGYILWLNAYVQDPYSAWEYYRSAEGRYDIEVDYAYSPPRNGVVHLGGVAYLETGGYWYDGQVTSSDIWVDNLPYGEVTFSATGYFSYGARFFATLLPSNFSFEGGILQEQLYGGNDSCYAQNRDGPQADFPIRGPEVISQNTYKDEINVPYVDWYDLHGQMVYTGQIAPCGWSVGQIMLYNGWWQVAQRTLGQTLTGTSVETYRDITYSVPWLPVQP